MRKLREKSNKIYNFEKILLGNVESKKKLKKNFVI